MPRAKQTAIKISEATGYAIEYSDLFVERMKPKSLSGKPHSDKAAADLWKDWEVSFYKKDEGIEGAENYSRIIERANKALDFLLSKDEDNIVVVTHGYFLRVLVSKVLLADNINPILFDSLMKADMENTGLTVLKYTEGFDSGFRWRLWIHNDHAHLAE